MGILERNTGVDWLQYDHDSGDDDGGGVQDGDDGEGEASDEADLGGLPSRRLPNTTASLPRLLRESNVVLRAIVSTVVFTLITSCLPTNRLEREIFLEPIASTVPWFPKPSSMLPRTEPIDPKSPPASSGIPRNQRVPSSARSTTTRTVANTRLK